MSFAFKKALAAQFGKYANVTPIQQSFVKVQMALSFNDDPAQLNEVAKQLEMDIHKVKSKPNSPKRNKHLVMKAYTHLIRGGFTTTFDPSLMRVEDSENALKLLEPIKFTTEGIFAYILALQNSFRILMAKGFHNMDKALQYLHEAEELFEKFKEKYPLDFDQKAMNFSQIFGVINPEKTVLSENHLHTTIFLGNCYNVMDNTEMQLKYAVPVIIARLTLESPEIHQTILPIKREIRSLLSHFHFAQVNHILSVLMFLLEKERCLPDAEKYKINIAQANISYLFAHYALEIAGYSIKWRKNKISHEKEFPINSNVIRLEKFVEPGVEMYENQFPCEPLVTREDYKKTLKKAKAWCQRAIDMYVGLSKDKLVAISAIDLILEFQQTVDNLQDLP